MTDEAITQADRDAAADYVSHGGEIETAYHKRIRSGEYDHPLSLAFARHRARSDIQVSNLVSALKATKHELDAMIPLIYHDVTRDSMQETSDKAAAALAAFQEAP